MKEINYDKVLDLSLTYHWYDEIASGRKKEEYREIKKFYCSRLGGYCRYKTYDFGGGLLSAGVSGTPNCRKDYGGCWDSNIYHKTYDYVRFHRGQGGKEIMLVECKYIYVGIGNPEWGAPIDKDVFIIGLGNIIYDWHNK
jgi:hypothetical protein